MTAAHPGSPAFSKTFHNAAIINMAMATQTTTMPIPTPVAAALFPELSDCIRNASKLPIDESSYRVSANFGLIASDDSRACYIHAHERPLHRARILDGLRRVGPADRP